MDNNNKRKLIGYGFHNPIGAFHRTADYMNDKNNLTGCLIQGDCLYSKEELNKRINVIKKKIGKLNSDEVIVAIAIPRNVYLITTIIALYESNITFLPIDLEQPYERIKYMLNIAEIKTIFTVSGYRHMFEEYSLFLVDERSDKRLESSLIQKRKSNKRAYVLFTSGTTGKPKGVEVTRKGFENFIHSIPQYVDFPKKPVILCLTSSSFDIFLLESVMALYCGFCIVLANEEEQKNPRKIVELLKKHSINIVQFTPSRLKMIELVDRQFESLMNVETILVGGEKFPNDLLKKLQNKTKARIYNMYGPTETTIWSTVSELTNKCQVDIGKPISNTTVYILDNNLDRVKFGEVGEICIAGDGLAIGYVNAEEQTRQSFRTLGYPPYERIYRTGDLGYYDSYGNIICLGRTDEQIKYHGHRIELEDIETNLSTIEGIHSCIACFDDESNQIILFYIGESIVNEAVVKSIAKKVLPYYMVPHRIIRVERFSYNTSGKVNRNAMINDLHQRDIALNIEQSMVCSNRVENEIIRLIKEESEAKCIGVTMSTLMDELALGSISYINLLCNIEELFDIEFEDEKLAVYAFETVEEVVIYVDNLMRVKANKNNGGICSE